MEAVPDIITWAKRSQFLSSVDIISSDYLSSGRLDKRHPELLRMERMTLEYLYSKSPDSPDLPLIANYVLSLCGKYLSQAKVMSIVNLGAVKTYWTAKQTNTLPTEEEILTWSTGTLYTAGVSGADFTTYIGTPSYLYMAEPKTENPKSGYWFSADDNGGIGTTSTWAEGVIVGRYRVYISNYKTETANLPVQFIITT
jgi:hypothetical protein